MNQRDERRRFTASEKLAIEVATGASGAGDHIVPHAAGGKTSVENCQLVSRSVNSRKGAFVFQPRSWQVEFLDAWKSHKQDSFLLIAIPGGGKTMAALEAARIWMRAGRDRRIVVVVPTTNLQEQWRDEAAMFGIDIQTKEFGPRFKKDFHGVAITYQAVASNPVMLRALCGTADTMVIFDEVHHCGDEKAFGDAVTSAFVGAKQKLLLSGTPWRTEGTPIPFVRYDAAGYAIGDYAYDYPKALTDKVVRNLVFDYSRGSVTNQVTGETLTLASDTSEEEAAASLRRLLDAKGDFVREQIRIAHEQLLSVRRTIPDAAAMAACADQGHAVAVAETIRQVTGCDPCVIVSDADAATGTVKDFRKSGREWLVSVRQVSEGTDINRLQVLCYLTNTTSEMFFRQLIGRVSRVRGKGDAEGYVFLPADPRLIAAAKNIEELQRVALAIMEREVQERDRDNREREGQHPFLFTTSHEGTDFVMVGSDAVSSDVAAVVQQAAETYGVTMQQALGIFRMCQASHQQVASHQPVAVSKEEQQESLRKACQRAANKRARQIGCDVKDVHMRFNKSQSKMTTEELRHKLATLTSEIEREEIIHARA